MTGDEDNTFSVEDRRNHGFFIIDNELLTEYAQKITPYGIAVYCALVMHAGQPDSQGRRECWPSYKTLSKVTGVKKTMLVETLHLLVENELIEIKSGRRGERGKANVSNHYIILPLKEYRPRKRRGASSHSELGASSSGELASSHSEQASSQCDHELDSVNNTQRTINNNNAHSASARVDDNKILYFNSNRTNSDISPGAKEITDIWDISTENSSLTATPPDKLSQASGATQSSEPVALSAQGASGLSPQAQSAVDYLSELKGTRRRPRNADNAFFEALAADFSPVRVRIGLHRAVRLGNTATAQQIRRTIELLKPFELSEYDSEGNFKGVQLDTGNGTIERRRVNSASGTTSSANPGTARKYRTLSDSELNKDW